MCAGGSEGDSMAQMAKKNEPPSLTTLCWCFAVIGIQSFGSGMSAWIRREVVDRRGWIDDPAFAAGLALSQISPGASGVNLAVFIGATLRGWSGALATFSGMMLPPIAIALAAGAAWAAARNNAMLDTALNGMGSAAVGLILANGLRLMRRNIRDVPGALVLAGTTLAVGVLHLGLLPVLAVALPVSLALNWKR
jgi:chromate transporter